MAIITNFPTLMVIHITPRPLFRILPIRHIITLTHQVCWIGLIQINTCPSLNIMNKTGTIITTFHIVKRDTTPPNHIVDHHSNIQPMIFLVMINQSKKNLRLWKG